MEVTAAVLREVGGDFGLEKVRLDAPRPGEVLVQISAVGICHTDLATRDGAQPFPLPGVLGHEGAGVVVEVGEGVTSASADTELRGRRIRAGDRLMLLYASGSRDEEVFEDPDVFNVERPVKHISFGAGPHACVGMHVAKLKMGIMLEELLRRINGIELTGKPKYAYTNFVGGLKRLPVRLLKA